MDYIPIKTREVDGGNCDRGRNQPRVLVEVESCAGRTTVKNEALSQGDVRTIEFYVDELSDLAPRVQDDSQREAWRMAERAHKGRVKQWLKGKYRGNKGKQEAIDRMGDDPVLSKSEHKECNEHPALMLPMFGYERGIGPLSRAEVVDYNDASNRVPLHDFLALSREEQEPYLAPPPVTSANQHLIAADHTARTLAAAMDQLMEQRRGGGRRRRKPSSDD